MRKVSPLFLCLILFLLSITGSAQTQGALGKRFFSNWSIGVSGGPNIFFGDLKVYRFWPVSTNMNEWRFAGSFYLTRQISHVFAVRGQVLYGEISGTKRNYSDGAPANLYFEGNILEYNLNATINFSNLIFRYKPERKFFVYGTVGAGLSNWITKKKDLQTHEQIGGSGSESNWTTELVLPAGLGAYYSIADKVNLGLEWTLRALNSDKLDATVGGYPYDMYSNLVFNVTYNFNKRDAGKPKSSQNQRVVPPPPPKHAQAVFKATDPPQQRPNLKPPVRPDTTLQLTSKPKPAEPKIDTIPEDPDWTPSGDEAAPVEKGITYRVQVFAFRSNDYPAEAIRARFRIKQPVWKEYTEGWFRYTVGSFRSLKAARQSMNQFRAHGISDAFVARYKNGHRIPTFPK
jgi:hypothetical protein